MKICFLTVTLVRVVSAIFEMAPLGKVDLRISKGGHTLSCVMSFIMSCVMRMMPDMKVALSTHCHAMHQLSLLVRRDKMASSGMDTDDYIAIALALDTKKRKKSSKRGLVRMIPV